MLLALKQPTRLVVTFGSAHVPTVLQQKVLAAQTDLLDALPVTTVSFLMRRSAGIGPIAIPLGGLSPCLDLASQMPSVAMTRLVPAPMEFPLPGQIVPRMTITNARNVPESFTSSDCDASLTPTVMHLARSKTNQPAMSPMQNAALSRNVHAHMAPVPQVCFAREPEIPSALRASNHTG